MSRNSMPPSAMSPDLSPIIRLHADDNVVVARTPIAKEDVVLEKTGQFTALEKIDRGHKIATAEIPTGSPVRKFGQIIGYASQNIERGNWVHVHNVIRGPVEMQYEFSTELHPAAEPTESRSFRGYRRANGKVGTRNYIGIVSTVNCSATASKYVAQQLQQTILEDYENVDGIVALVHKGGCAFDYDNSDHQQLARTLAGFAQHPNIGAYLILGLGCETSQASYVAQNHNLVQLNVPGLANDDVPLVMNIQEQGGVAKTVDRAKAVLKELLPEANKATRTSIPASELILATECGGSDGYSGITANPAIGYAADLLVGQGGTAILSEVPEIYGGEHLLTRRSISRQVGEKLLERIRWWEQYAEIFQTKIDNNPSVGNKQGGLTTIFEKSLGAIAKGGTTPLTAVYEYAEPITEKGFVVMDTPGYDPASVTGMVAGGANLVVFSTGRGSCFGCKPVPSMKVCSNPVTFGRMQDDMDIDAGRILNGASVEEVGSEIFEELLKMASGTPSKSEAQGIGDEEFCPWVPGPIF